MDNDDCDLFSILHSCKANTHTSPTTIFESLPPPQNLTTTSTITNSIISPQNTTLSYFDDFSLAQEDRSVNFSPLKPTDFIELDKLKTNFNPSTVIPTYTTTITPTTTILASSNNITTTNIPISNHKTTTIITNTFNHDSNQSSNLFDFPTLIREPQMQPTDIIGPEKTIPNLNQTTIMPISTISAPFSNPCLPSNIFTPSAINTTPSITTMTNTNTSCHGTNNYPKIYNFPKLFEQQKIQQNQNNHLSSLKPAACIEITAAHFDLDYNHPPISKQHARESNQLSNLQPLSSSELLQNTDPQGELCISRKRKFDNQKIVEWHISVEKLGEDPWKWRKYGQKPIKGSRHPRDYYQCSTLKDCLAKKRVEKKPNKENIYVVTYIGEHNHPKPVVHSSPHNKSSKKRLSNVTKHGSLPNIRNSASPSMVMSHIDKPECNNAQVHQH